VIGICTYLFTDIGNFIHKRYFGSQHCISRIFGSDQRIGYSFIYPGAGYGGSCFPKDVKALTKIAKENGYTAQLITAVEEVNDAQKLIIAQKIVNRFGEDLTGFTFGIWGLAFKPGTDDMREAQQSM
jgi:UDPglucose 6-dehydrogenase